MALYTDRLHVLNTFLAKADGKDKLTATIQYACLLLSGGEPGNIKKIQASVTAARKVFRVMRPLESLMPVLVQPGFVGKQPLPIEALTKIGLANNKVSAERWQKVSLWSWALGSVCTVITESYALMELTQQRKQGESEEEWRKREQARQDAVNQKTLLLVHGLLQAALAAGLLQLLPFKPRTVGLIGTATSALNCYMLLPPMPKAKKA